MEFDAIVIGSGQAGVPLATRLAQSGVGGERHRGAAVILNAGARPVEPPIPGLREVAWLDNRRVMQLRELPSHLVVAGGGYIGCELAQAYRRFGSAVTIVEPGAHLPSFAEGLQSLVMNLERHSLS